MRDTQVRSRLRQGAELGQRRDIDVPTDRLPRAAPTVNLGAISSTLMPHFEHDGVSLYYEDASGRGFPLLLLAPGGMNATISSGTDRRSTRLKYSKQISG